MSIIRTHKEQKYSVIDNIPINDSSLSWGARGILIYLLSKPDNWEVNAAHLVNVGKEGKSAVNVRLKELEKAGYIYRERTHNEKGQIGWISHVYETPAQNPYFKPVAENQEMDKSSPPFTDFPETDNRTRISTELINTETTLNPKGLSVEKPITDEQPNLSPIKEKSSSQKTVSPARPKTQIKDKFIDLTGMSMPKVKNQQGYWWSQFGEILHIAKDDPGDACDALCQVVSYMQKEKLCISGPQSVVGLCRAVIAGQKLNGGTNEKTSRHSQSNGRPDGHSLGTIAFNPKTGETVHVG